MCRRLPQLGTHLYSASMSRAFVNEDKAVEDLPDRPVSENFRRQQAEAQASGDRAALAKAGRELRYWSVRRASAQLVEARPSVDIAQFGSTVTIVRDDGRRETFQIVGEDEANPSQGTISHVSPLAKSLLGRKVGEVVRAGRDDAEIAAIR
jgi:transcription elongation GreA/GreB family factor